MRASFHPPPPILPPLIPIHPQSLLDLRPDHIKPRHAHPGLLVNPPLQRTHPDPLCPEAFDNVLRRVVPTEPGLLPLPVHTDRFPIGRRIKVLIDAIDPVFLSRRTPISSKGRPWLFLPQARISFVSSSGSAGARFH